MSAIKELKASKIIADMKKRFAEFPETINTFSIKIRKKSHKNF